MKFSYTHLPAQVQSDLKHICDFLLEQTAVTNKSPYHRYTPSHIRHIMLHGCFTEDHWTPETILHPAEVSYRYNIMVIVSAHLCDILPILERAVEQLNQSGRLNYPVVAEIIDTKGRIDQKLRNGYLAYDQIQTRGILVYSRGEITRDLFTPLNQPGAEKHYIQALHYFDHAFPLAKQFLSGARAYKDKDRNAAAFMLNIAAAQAYEAFMVVHILKYPLGRPLNDLRELAESIHSELAMVWTGLQGEQTFDHLSAAFRDVRFSAYYHVTDSTLNAMFGYVEDLHKLVHHICKLKFEALKAGSLAKPDKDGLETVRDALKPPEDSLFDDDDEDDEAQQTTVPDPSPILRTTEQAASNNALSGFLCDLDGACSELYTLADILLSLTDLTAGAASSCEFALISQFLQERTRKIANIHEQMATLLEPAPAVEGGRKAGAAA
ncbi:hypothetical protein [Paremcibacter congregatus]|uniref:hypothetical protein n=1 Tax=Paremcibacter congregatus TaxID=2043170 RepID=UPI0030ED3D5A